MKISAAELRKRIEQGEDLEAISLSLISPAERELLKCCAVVRTFDEKLVNNYFSPHVAGRYEQSIPFSALLKYDFVQRVPRTDDVYFLLPAARKQYYDAWWESSDGAAPVSRNEVPESLRKLSQSLVEHYAALGDAGKLDLLGQQIFVDKEKACDVFEELYKKADAAFDLARCRDIVNVLTGREDVLGPVLAKTLNGTDRYLQARSLWATEYYQTVNYYNRDELTRKLKLFLTKNAKPRPENKWILHLHAPGGMGKTMFVRWLISRRCVPEPYRIPCGRVDFDFVDRVTASQHRWRLFLEIARDLDVQIPGYFNSLITKFSDYERILNHQETQQTTATQLPPRKKLEDEILYLFRKALKDAKLKTPVILIFDTLEEVILYHPDDLLEIVRMVKRLREANVLLVLSGRYDLTEKTGPDKTTRLPQFNKEFGDDFTQTVRVKPFEKEEALGFLKMRGLTEDRPLDIVIERSEKNPFKLALFADLLLDDPEITEETIRGYPSTDLLYLIERVLARIPDDKLHWLLRYGVVPPKLTFSFLKDVIKPHLERAIAGDRSQDDPSRYVFLTPRARATVQQKKIFVKDVGDSPAPVLSDDQLNKLWADLQNYASKFAWITMEASDPYTAGFHGDVVNPMRRWLEENPVYRLLHQDAIAYFENKARTDPSDWTKWTRNAIYHKFQLEGVHAADYWRQLITAEEDPSRRRELANEVIGSEFVDENFRPRLLLEGQEIISLSTLAEAYYELARACVGIARAQNAPASDRLWSDADYDLERCEQIQKELAQPVVSPAYLASVRAAILTSQNLGDKAIAVIEQVLEADLDDRALLRLEAELANAYASQANFEKAIAFWESALQRAESGGRSQRFIIETRRRLARLHRDQHDFEAGAQNLLKALDFVRPDDAKTRAELLGELADVYFEMGQFSRARETFEDVHKSLEGLPSEVADVRYLNQLTRYFFVAEDPRQALGVKETIGRDVTVADRAASEDVRKVLNALSIQSFEQTGMFYSMLLEVEIAREAFETARSRWREIGDSKAAKRCMLKKVELFLKAGEVNQASAMLDEANRLTIEHDPEQWLQELLLRLRIWYFRREMDRLETGIQVIEKRAADERWGPILRAKLILGAGTWKLVQKNKTAANQFTSDLTATLREIEPPSVRMLLLDPLSEYPSFKDIDYQIAEDLLNLFPLRKGDDDYFIHAPRVAELLRVVGRKDHAVSLLKDLISSAPKENSFALRRVLLTLGRTSPRHGKRSDVMKFVKTFLNDYKVFPVLCGSTLVELAELSFAARSANDRLDLLNQAEEFLKSKGEDSQWMARSLALRGTLTIKNRRKEALDQLQRAISINQELGNRRAVENLQRFIETSEVQTHAGVAADDKSKEAVPPRESEVARGERDLAKRLPKMTVLVDDHWTESLFIRTVLPGETEAMTRELAIQPPSVLDDLLAFDTYENYSFKFLRQIDSDWITTCRELGRILMDETQVRNLRKFEAATTQKPALRLIIKALQLSSAPWELMVLPGQPPGPASVASTVSYFYRSLPRESVADIVWLQTALSQLGSEKIAADRIYGKKTEEAVKRFQQEHGLPDHGRFDGRTRSAIKRALHASQGRTRPRVLLLRPGIERQRATSRGQQVYGLSLDDWYASHGFRELVVLEDPYVEIVEKTLVDFKPDVVHICPTMEESTSVGIYLDFGSGGTGVMPRRASAKGSADLQSSPSPSGDVQFLTLSTVSELMRRELRQDRARPLLILDVLQPAGQTELFTQLFLRNAFAAQLYELGSFESIIATGLTPPELQEDITRTLIQAIGSFESVGDTINRLRRMVDVGSYTHLAPVGTNLGPLRDPSDRSYQSTVVATAGIALFTQDPDM